MNAHSKPFEIVLVDENASARLGSALGKILKNGDFVALYGDLGAGKTTLSRAIINQMMGHTTEVPSPTFTMLQIYDAPEASIYHFDLYRIKSPDEVWELGYEEISNAIALIEWPERLGANIAPLRLEINLSFNAKGRIATIKYIDDEKLSFSFGERLKSVINEFI